MLDLNANAERFTGFADTYDAYRPQPPVVIVDILTQLAQVEKPPMVVDLGCGTGLSTRIWANRADDVVGVDIVTCSQSLHWMEPESTFVEISRILRDGGVFATIDCDWPPVMNWEVETAYIDFMRNIRALESSHGVYKSVQRWSKDEHLSRIRASGRFRYAREVLVHNVESGDADRLVGLALSFGSVQDLIKLGVSEDEMGLDKLREVGARVIGNKTIPWHFSYRVRLGIKQALPSNRLRGNMQVCWLKELLS